MKLFKLLPIVLLVAVVSACKDDIPAVEYKSQGFIQGTIDATASDDETDIDETFKYTQYQQTITYGEAYTGYELNDDGSIEVVIFRQDLANGGYVYMGFELEDEDDTTPDDMFFQIQFFKEKKDQIIFFSMSSSSNEFDIDDFTFDIETGNTTGTFSLEGSNNSTDNDADIEGSFNIKLRPIVF